MDLQKVAEEMNRRTQEIEKMRMALNRYEEEVYPEIIKQIETMNPIEFVNFYHSLKDDSDLKLKLYKHINKKANE